MKGGIQGLKVSQISLILIGVVCVIVLGFTWMKTSLLTSFIPSQNRVLQLDLDNAGPRETLGGNNNSVHTWKKQIDSFSSSGKPEIGNIEDVTIEKGSETPASVVERTGSEKVSQRKNKSNQADKSDVQSDQTGTLSANNGKKESFFNSSSVRAESFVGVMERTDSDEHSHRKNKSKQIDVPESVKSDQTGNMTATASKKDIPPSAVERTASHKNHSKQREIVPGDSLTKESSVKTEQIRNSSSITRNKDCNYAKGKWVFDDSRPLYSGSSCKQWLSSMWACRLTQRTDFDYEKLLWQPKGCKVDAFTGPKFLQRMQHKTLAFIGDSLGRQQFQSLMCMATGGEERTDVLDVGREYGLVKARGAVRPDGWAYRFPSTNTTVLYYWSASLSDLVPIDPNNSSTNIAMHLDRPPAFLRRFINKFHVIVLNTGHHWNRGKLDANRWVMYVGGHPNTNRKIAEIAGAKSFTVHSIVKWVDSQLPLYPGLKAFYRSISPRHFFNGDWNTGGTCDNTTPHGKEVIQDESSDSVAAGAVRGTDVKLLDITALSELRDEGHISRYSIRATPGMQDCLHWCLPGIPDVWNEILFAQI